MNISYQYFFMAISIMQFGSSDANYGDMCIAVTESGVFMIDGGATKNDANLLSAAINKLGFSFDFILSHWHCDHYSYMLNYAGVTKPAPRSLIHGIGRKVTLAYPNVVELNISAGKTYTNGDISVHASECTVISTDVDDAAVENDNSMVTVIKNDNKPAFFSFGDASKTAIEIGSYAAVFTQIADCPYPIIKLPHHGSYPDCGAVLDKIGDKEGVYVISGCGGSEINNTIRRVLEIKNSKLFWISNSAELSVWFNSATRTSYNEYIRAKRFILCNRVLFEIENSENMEVTVVGKLKLPVFTEAYTRRRTYVIE